MNESEKEKDSPPDKKSLLPFIMATVFSLPSWISLVSIAINSLKMWWHTTFHPGIEASYETYFIFSFPIIIVLNVLACFLVVMFWKNSPRWCRFIMPFCFLSIIIWFVFLFDNSGAGMGP